MKITIDLAGATPMQLENFSDARLPDTLAEIRSSIGDGDGKADIEIRKPGTGMRLHVMQTLDDLNNAAVSLGVHRN